MKAAIVILIAVVGFLVVMVLTVSFSPPDPYRDCWWSPMYAGSGQLVGMVCYVESEPRHVVRFGAR